MVALEMGLALVLVVSAGLMVRTVSSLMDEELGFEPENVVTARITLPEPRYPGWAQRHRFWDDLMERVLGLPGVEGAGLTSALPLNQTPDADRSKSKDGSGARGKVPQRDRAGSPLVTVRRTTLTSLLMGLSMIALRISCLGVYAVTAQAVRGRRQEIGIRMALGASSETVLRSVILTESRVIAVGILLGLGAAVAATRVLETLLFGITALDPLTLIVSAATLGGVAILAVLGPALRAARTDPAGALAADQ